MPNLAPYAGTLFDLRGKSALLTGASAGMGFAMAQSLGQAGAKVVINGLDQKETQNAAQLLREQGIDASAYACDVSQKSQVIALYEFALKTLGRIDILICNAGVAPPPASMLDINDETWQQVQQLNLQSPHWLASLVLPKMAEHKDGAIVFTASLSSLRGNKYLGLYGVTKAGVAQLARNLAVEWGPQNIRVNAISPGVVRTRFASPMLNNPAIMEKRLALTPLRRVGEPNEIASVVLLLSSSAGAYITGQNIVIDGGTLVSDGN